MRKIFIAFCLALFSTGAIMAQVGLEGIIVENYYVSNAVDQAYSDPGAVDQLPAGAVTYRMYVDMLPGWELQAIFGATDVGTLEVDTLVFRSTAPFWNHQDRGDLYGYNIAANQIDENTVALDSWFSTGRPSASTGGVLEVSPSEDTNGSTPTFPHNPATLLINTDPLSGLPLTTEDGNVPLTSTITWTPTPGFETIMDPMFGTTSYSPANQVLVSDGALGVTVTLQGPSAANRVLIGQFTTAGVFSGKINIQIREVATGIVEQYVAETPASGQFTHPSLVWGPNALPTVAITAPTEGQNFTAPTTVNFNATASDSDGSIATVQFYLNGVAFGAPIAGPGPSFSTTWPTGIGSSSNQLIAVATDNDGATRADTVNFTVTGNPAPVVNLTAPNTAVVGQTVNISATATDADGIASVQFFFNNVAIGAPIPGPGPYMTSFTATPAGSYTGVNAIRATALDNAGVSASDAENLVVSPNQAPTATITAPVDGAFISEGPVTINANSVDTDGTVTQVEFFANGVSIGVDNSGPAPFSISWNAVYATHAPSGDVQLTARATDNLGLLGAVSPIVDVTIINPAGSPYILDDVNQECNDATVCMPVTVISAISNVIGFDMVLEFDNSLVYPTGNITKSGALLNANLFETDYSIDLVNEKMIVSVFLDVDAPFGTFFAGTGDIICVEFAKRPAFQPVDTTTIDVTFFQESYFSEVVSQIVPSGDFTTYRNTIMTSNLEFWLDNKAIGYDGANPIVNIQANTSIDCSLPSAATPAVLAGPVVNPDVNGNFTYDLTNGVKFSIDKDLAGTTDVQEVINGFDALLTRRILIDDANFTPSVYQAIAADVNRDGVISAGDVSQINQRAVLILNEFRQAWNYAANGTQLPGYAPSKDWQFIDLSTVLFNPNYQISSNYPQDNGVGFSKQRVPQVPFCLTGPVTSFATCPVINDETYVGIMYGDINGNWRNTSDVLLRAPYSVDVNLKGASYSEEYVDVPVSFTSIENVNAIDLNLDFDINKLAFHSIISNGVQAVGHFNEQDQKLRVTSNSLDVLKEGEAAFMIRFTRLSDATINVSDFNAAVGYLNGDKVNVDFVAPGVTSNNDVYFNVFPNPTSDFIYIGISKDVTAEIVDMNGRVMAKDIKVAANSKQRVDVSAFPVGLYTIRVFSNDYTSAQRVFVGK
jgi:hypothetical protein